LKRFILTGNSTGSMMALGVKKTRKTLGTALEGVKRLICRLRAAMFNHANAGDENPRAFFGLCAGVTFLAVVKLVANVRAGSRA
jgi:hypothetical protein